MQKYIMKTSRDRVKGFLKADGRKIVNQDNDEILLIGWGFGNWLLPEGYMWLSGDSKRFDRPRRISRVIRELTGTEYAKKFWNEYKRNYISKKDVEHLAALGYNSVRLPLNWSDLMLDELRINWNEEGFSLIDKFVSWCEEYNIYVFLDLHGAPGGQTGSNIDDSIDDFPRLFTSQDYQDKAVALWVKIAERYKNKWIVGGYDILNEPLRPNAPGLKDCEYLVPKLAEFYERVIEAIRKVDKKHMLSIEGHRWATDNTIFYKRYDDNMVLHFHRYACLPTLESYQKYLDVAEKLDVPLWLGETGENTAHWFSAMYPLCLDLNIGYNLWPWKKMDCYNSPMSVNKPEGWDKIIEYSRGGERPEYIEAQSIFDEFLNNIKFDNCTRNDAIVNAAFRNVPCSIRATDFDELPGKGVSYSGIGELSNNIYGYRNNCYMKIIKEDTFFEKKFPFDCGLEQYRLSIGEGEFVCYTVNNIEDKDSISLVMDVLDSATIEIKQDNESICVIEFTEQKNVKSQKIALKPCKSSVIKIQGIKGNILIAQLDFMKKEICY